MNNIVFLFLQYMWNHEWFWDRAAAYQNNLRFVYLGLTNKQGEYRWLDGTTLGYETSLCLTMMKASDVLMSCFFSHFQLKFMFLFIHQI